MCSARADIDKQLRYLQGLTIATATATGVENSLKAVGSDLKKIKDAQPQLDAQRKQQVQSANQEFSAVLQSVARNVGTEPVAQQRRRPAEIGRSAAREVLSDGAGSDQLQLTAIGRSCRPLPAKRRA